MNQEERDRLLREARDSSIRTEEHIRELFKNYDKHDARLTRLEFWQWKVMGGGSVIAGALVAFKDKILGVFS